MPGATATERERNFFVIFSAMAGAVSIARFLPSLPTGRECWLVSGIIFCIAFEIFFATFGLCT